MAGSAIAAVAELVDRSSARPRAWMIFLVWLRNRPEMRGRFKLICMVAVVVCSPFES